MESRCPTAYSPIGKQAHRLSGTLFDQSTRMSLLIDVTPGAAQAVVPASVRLFQSSTVPVRVTLPSWTETSMLSGVNRERLSTTMTSDLMRRASAIGLMAIWFEMPVAPHSLRTASAAASWCQCQCTHSRSPGHTTVPNT